MSPNLYAVGLSASPSGTSSRFGRAADVTLSLLAERGGASNGTISRRCPPTACWDVIGLRRWIGAVGREPRPPAGAVATPIYRATYTPEQFSGGHPTERSSSGSSAPFTKPLRPAEPSWLATPSLLARARAHHPRKVGVPGPFIPTDPSRIYHEHPDWFRPLFTELERRGVPYARLGRRAPSLRARCAARPPYSLLFNRMSPSAWRRGVGHGIFYTAQYLDQLERHRRARGERHRARS